MTPPGPAASVCACFEISARQSISGDRCQIRGQWLPLRGITLGQRLPKQCYYDCSVTEVNSYARFYVSKAALGQVHLTTTELYSAPLGCPLWNLLLAHLSISLNSTEEPNGVEYVF